ARRADADHELVRGLELLAAALVAQVAVVLLVAAVELHQALVLERQRAGDRVGQPFDQRAPQPAAAGLDVFDGGMAHVWSGFARCAPSSALRGRAGVGATR